MDEDLLQKPLTLKEIIQLLSATTVTARITAQRHTIPEWTAMGFIEVDQDGGYRVNTKPDTKDQLRYGARPNPYYLSTTDPRSIYSQVQIGLAPITLAGGSAADQALVPAVAGYYGMIEIIGVECDTTKGITFTFQDEDNTACVGGIGGVLVADLTANVYNTGLRGAHIYSAVAGKALEVDVSGGAGAEKVMIDYLYWREHA